MQRNQSSLGVPMLWPSDVLVNTNIWPLHRHEVVNKIFLQTITIAMIVIFTRCPKIVAFCRTMLNIWLSRRRVVVDKLFLQTVTIVVSAVLTECPQLVALCQTKLSLLSIRNDPFNIVTASYQETKSEHF